MHGASFLCKVVKTSMLAASLPVPAPLQEGFVQFNAIVMPFCKLLKMRKKSIL
jgi:hypothetical protein